jgi:hypothetical protein
LHFGVADGQSGSSLHCAQRPSSQIGVGAAQSVFTTQATHAPRPVLHFGVVPPHCASLVQPAARHSCSSRSQRGADAPQSAFDRHTTHFPSFVAQRGFAAGQSAFVAHATHRFVTASQIGDGAAQSAFPLQSTHAPVDASQSFAPLGHDPAPVHAGWHS